MQSNDVLSHLLAYGFEYARSLIFQPGQWRMRRAADVLGLDTATQGHQPYPGQAPVQVRDLIETNFKQLSGVIMRQRTIITVVGSMKDYTVTVLVTMTGSHR